MFSNAFDFGSPHWQDIRPHATTLSESTLLVCSECKYSLQYKDIYRCVNCSDEICMICSSCHAARVSFLATATAAVDISDCDTTPHDHTLLPPLSRLNHSETHIFAHFPNSITIMQQPTPKQFSFPVVLSIPQSMTRPALGPVTASASASAATSTSPVADHDRRRKQYNVISHAAICDQCEQQIHGVRYKCANCKDYDLCESCYSCRTRMLHTHHQSGSHIITHRHSKYHVFLCIVVPIPTPHSIGRAAVNMQLPLVDMKLEKNATLQQQLSPLNLYTIVEERRRRDELSAFLSFNLATSAQYRSALSESEASDSFTSHVESGRDAPSSCCGMNCPCLTTTVEVVCDGCDSEIKPHSQRFHCMQCENYDLCRACVDFGIAEDLHEQQHVFLLLTKPVDYLFNTEPESRLPDVSFFDHRQSTRHIDVHCMRCDQEICGVRWKCANCASSYDLCDHCFHEYHLLYDRSLDSLSPATATAASESATRLSTAVTVAESKLQYQTKSQLHDRNCHDFYRLPSALDSTFEFLLRAIHNLHPGPNSHATNAIESNGDAASTVTSSSSSTSRPLTLDPHFSIKPAKSHHLKDILVLEKRVFGDCCWGERMMRHMLAKRNSIGLVVIESDTPAAIMSNSCTTATASSSNCSSFMSSSKPLAHIPELIPCPSSIAPVRHAYIDEHAIAFMLCQIESSSKELAEHVAAIRQLMQHDQARKTRQYQTEADPSQHLTMTAKYLLNITQHHAQQHSHFDVLCISSIAVDTRFRGRGIGSSLLRHIKHMCRTQLSHVRAMILHVNCHNIVAQKLYKRHGFEIIRRELQYYDQKGDAYVMAALV
jgi:ribosomal protein S18 acetylase RimI-like enzyme